MSRMKKPGTYEFLKFQISALNRTEPFIDIRGLIHEWEIIESMDSGNFHGSATVYDSVGLLDNYADNSESPWIKGEELITIEYRDFYENTVSHKMFLYAVTDVKDLLQANNSTRYYKIHFTSIDKFLTERYLVRVGFRDNTISEYVRNIFDAYYRSSDQFSGKPITISETEGDQNLVVPNYSPEQTMHFFARKAYGPSPRGEGNDFSQTWRFFETRNKYYFTNHGDIAREAAGSFARGTSGTDSAAGNIQNTAVTYSRLDEADKTPEGNLAIQQSILDMTQHQYINTLEDMVDGGYYSSLTELDFINRSPSFVEYRYLDDYQIYDQWPGPNARSKHSKTFVDTHMNLLRDRIVVKDYGSPNDPGADNFVRPETYYPQMYNQKRVNFYHHKSQSYTVKVYGNNFVMPGTIINLNVRKVSNQLGGEPDALRNGRYLVESARSVFSGEMYYQILEVSNSGIRGQKESANTYDRERQALSSYTHQFDVRRISDGVNGGEGAVDGTQQDVGDGTSSDASAGARTTPGDMNGDIIDYVMSKEGFQAEPYWDNGHWSIGYGTRASGPNEGPITRSEARARLIEDLNQSRQYVINYGQTHGYNWNDRQIDALSSFAYNGGNGFIRQVTNGGTRDNETIASRMLLYSNAGGRSLPGLVIRRQEESAMFRGAIESER